MSLVTNSFFQFQSRKRGPRSKKSSSFLHYLPFHSILDTKIRFTNIGRIQTKSIQNVRTGWCATSKSLKINVQESRATLFSRGEISEHLLQSSLVNIQPTNKNRTDKQRAKSERATRTTVETKATRTTGQNLSINLNGLRSSDSVKQIRGHRRIEQE